MHWRMPSVNYNIASELSPGGPLVRALRARAGILLLITNQFSTEGLRAYGRRFSSSGALKCTKN